MNEQEILSLALQVATSPYLNERDRASAIESVRIIAAGMSADEVEQCKAAFLRDQQPQVEL